MNRVLCRFAIATWAAAAGLVGVFALFWRIAYAPPHAFWAIATTGTVAVAGILTVAIGLWRLIKGARRTLAVATVLLGTTPVVWLAMLALSLYLKQTSRAPTTIDTSARIVAFWAESIGDVEARWRYPRWIEGQHVILLDRGQTPEPQKLVGQMDAHIEQMVALFHMPVPTGRARWVRGSLLGVHGAAIISWAICDDDQNSADLTSLDRHEMAHIAITALGSVDQDPPMLLCEGWAETQSKDRKDLIFTLGQKVETGPIYSLEELVDPTWYGRSDGPVYDHGGPLCVYLMEHYGVEKFLALYHGVRHATFMADSERILGDSWKVVEDNFWTWLGAETAKIKSERGIKPTFVEPEKDLIFAKSVDPHDWQTIVDGYRAAWSKRPPMPSAFAFVKVNEWTSPPEEPGGAPDKRGLLSKYVVDKDALWDVRDYGPNRFMQAEVFKPTLSAFVNVMADGTISGSRPTDKSSVTEAIEDAERWSNTCDLAHYLPVGTKRVVYWTNSHIDAIRRPAAPNGTEWEIEYVSRGRDTGRETKNKLRVDAAADWSVVREEEFSPDGHEESRYTLRNVWGRQAPIEMVTDTTDNSGTSSFHSRFRELSSAEAAEVRKQAENIVRRLPETRWYAALFQPLVPAVVWPGTGMVLLVVGILLDQRRPPG